MSLWASVLNKKRKSFKSSATHYWDTCDSPVIKCLCFFVFFFPPPQNGKITQQYPVVIGPSTPWQPTVIQWGVHMLTTRVILMMIDVVMHGQGRVTWRTTRFLLMKLFCQSFLFQRVWITITWSIMAQTLKILTDAYTSRIVRGQSTLKDVIER